MSIIIKAGYTCVNGIIYGPLVAVNAGLFDGATLINGIVIDAGTAQDLDSAVYVDTPLSLEELAYNTLLRIYEAQTGGNNSKPLPALTVVDDGFEALWNAPGGTLTMLKDAFYTNNNGGYGLPNDYIHAKAKWGEYAPGAFDAAVSAVLAKVQLYGSAGCLPTPVTLTVNKITALWVQI